MPGDVWQVEALSLQRGLLVPAGVFTSLLLPHEVVELSSLESGKWVEVQLKRLYDFVVLFGVLDEPVDYHSLPHCTIL